MTRFTLPKRNKPDLTALRRSLIMATWLDLKLFGCTTGTVKALQRRIIKEKQADKVVSFPEPKLKRAA